MTCPLPVPQHSMSQNIMLKPAKTYGDGACISPRRGSISGEALYQKASEVTGRRPAHLRLTDRCAPGRLTSLAFMSASPAWSHCVLRVMANERTACPGIGRITCSTSSDKVRVPGTCCDQEGVRGFMLFTQAKLGVLPETCSVVPVSKSMKRSPAW